MTLREKLAERLELLLEKFEAARDPYDRIRWLKLIRETARERAALPMEPAS